MDERVFFVMKWFEFIKSTDLPFDEKSVTSFLNILDKTASQNKILNAIEYIDRTVNAYDELSRTDQAAVSHAYLVKSALLDIKKLLTE